MKRRLVNFLLWCIILSGVFSGSASGSTDSDIRFTVKKWTTDNGLPQNAVNDIIQTRDGYLWLATNDGLVRFDGHRFKEYNYYNLPGLKNNRFRFVVEDREGRMWTCAASGGLTKIEGNRARVYTSADGLVNDYVEKLYLDSKGVIWVIGQKNGVNRIVDGEILPFSVGGGLMQRRVRGFFIDSSGNQWISTDEPALYRIGGGRVSRFTSEHGLSGKSVGMMYEDSRKNLWFGSYDHIFRYQDGGFSVFASGFGSGPVHMLEDNDGNLLMATYNKGLYEVKKDGIFRIRHKFLERIAITKLMKDHEGTIWLGTLSAGFMRLKRSVVDTYSTQQGLSHYLILSLHQDKEGTVWVGTNGGGVSFYRDGSFAKLPFEKNGYFWATYTDSLGYQWFGSYGHGLYRYREGELTNFRMADGLPDDKICALMEDSQGNLWIGTWGGGLGVYHLESRRFSTYGKVRGFNGDFVISLFEDSGGRIWAGTSGLGVYVLENGLFKHYTTDHGLANNNVRTIYEDEDGGIWLGTYGGGLSRLKNGVFTTIDKNDGLYDNVVSTIIEDDYGYLWMTCNRGVYRVLKKELTDYADGLLDRFHCTYFNKEDGMVSAETNGGFHPAGWKTKDGKLWLPTIRGVAVFDPSRARVNRVPPPMVIEGMMVNGRDIDIGEAIQLPAGSRDVEIHYTGLSFVNPRHMRFKYQLEGADRRWKDAGGRRAAYYNRLRPGNYTFRVKACNNDGIWNEEGASFRFYVRPFFFQTWWFIPLMILAALALMFLVFRIRVRVIRRREKELAQRVEQQTRQLREANETAQREREAAESANQSKSEFLARMSHEIRTPLNSVIGFADMLKDTRLDEEQLDYVETLSRSGEVLISIIDDILDFSKVEAGVISFESIEFDPEMMAFDVCESILPRLSGRPVEVLCRIGDRVPGHVRHDAGRFRQVLVNLLGNAAKFTGNGEIELSVDVDEETDVSVKLHSKVRDTGIGIQEDKLDSIFDVFQQADGTITRQFGGTGLGLNICKLIARRMDGDIWVDSAKGEGSTFHFTAWVEKTPQARPEKIFTPNLAGKRVLIVDDNANNLDILEHMLEKFRMVVVKESHAGQVVQRIEENQNSGTPFDLCILDMIMPELDGCTVARSIRGLPFPAGQIPLLALPSLGAKHSGKYRDAGFNGFIPKPVQSKKLLHMIQRLLLEAEKNSGTKQAESIRQGDIITQHAIKERVKHNIRILLAEDHPVNRKLAEHMLSKAGYHVDFAANGREAVEMYTAEPENYDLILMDLQMPEMNGLEAARSIRRHGFGDIPIIAMTADSLEQDRQLCLDAGMNDFLPKPIRRELVFGIIKKWLL